MNQKQDSQQLLNSQVDSVLNLLRTIQKHYREHVYEQSKQYGFTGPQIMIIFALHKHPNATLNEISDRIGLSKSTVSGIVDRLVSQGAVKREIPEDNRRIVRLSLSEDFTGANDIVELKNKYFYDIFSSSNQDDIDMIIKGLSKLNELMEKKHGYDNAK